MSVAETGLVRADLGHQRGEVLGVALAGPGGEARAGQEALQGGGQGRGRRDELQGVWASATSGSLAIAQNADVRPGGGERVGAIAR